jgi:uncharacterized protein (TIGR01777 family)
MRFNMRALVTGATGFVGKKLLSQLDRPVVLTRRPKDVERQLAAFNARGVEWDINKPPAASAFDGIDTVFHLAGEPVAEGRWTAAKKQRLRESRVVGTRNLVAAMKGLSQKPKVLVSASAVGFYGDRGDEVLTESAAAAKDFLAEICTAWEHEALVAEEAGIRVVTLRIGIVLGPGGGALAKMLPPFQFGLGSALGNGRQYMPWIHRDDLVGMLLFAAENDSARGAMNAVSPNPVTNRDFTTALGKVLHRPTFFPPVPGFMLKLMFGEFGQILLHSQRAIPAAALQWGYSFKFPELQPALAEILKK